MMSQANGSSDLVQFCGVNELKDIIDVIELYYINNSVELYCFIFHIVSIRVITLIPLPITYFIFDSSTPMNFYNY